MIRFGGISFFLDRIKEVLEEVPNVRKASGYPPLVTPSSQIVGTQAVFNVIMGKYKVLTGEFADLMLGYYGSTLGEKDPEVLKRAGEHAKKEPITCRPADLLKPEWEQLRSDALALKGCNGSDEDVLTFAMFPQVAPKFFGTREQGPKNLSKTPTKAAPAPAPAAPKPAAALPNAAQLPGAMQYVITINGQSHAVSVAPAAK